LSRPPHLVLVVPDLFDRPNGIARISQALSLACAEWVERRGGRMSVRVLHDSGRRRDPRICPFHVELQGYSGNRARFALGALACASPSTLYIFGHVNFAPLGLAASVCGARHVVVAHGIEVWEPLSALRTLALRRAMQVWPVSLHTAATVTALHGLDADRVVPIRNCLDPLQPLASVTPCPEGPPRFLVVSRLSASDRYKGVDRAISAFARAGAALEHGARIEIVGDGDDRPRLEALARSEGVAEAVVFHGGVSDTQLDTLLIDCRAMVLPSLREGFGLVFVEAMARGRAVIATAAAATPEVVEDGVTGLLAGPQDEAGLVAALVTLGRDRERAARLGAAGRARLEAAFLFPRYARDVAAQLDACLETQ
jgi:phosphatidylinositol alpha-1,6-mannosyltransferase